MKGRLRAHNGQAMIVMVFALIGLLVAIGVAIDGGRVLLDRRRMQNASDAASLAGARRLAEATCNADSASAADADIYNEVMSYAGKNGVKSADQIEARYVKFAGSIVVECDADVGGGTVPTGAAGVVVTSTVSHGTYFVSVIGIDTAGAMADATAVNGPPIVMGGLRPFGVAAKMVHQMGAGECFTVDFKNCKDDDPDSCQVTDDEGEVIGEHRNWLNLNHLWNQGEDTAFPRATGGSANADDLQRWMSEGWNGNLFADCCWSSGACDWGWMPVDCRWGDFIHAKPGTTSSPINDTPINTEFAIPVFDVVPQYDTIPSPKADGLPQGSNYYYHIVGFAVVTVGSGDADMGAGTIRACFGELITGKGEPAPNPGYGSDVCSLHTMVVGLWR